MKDETLLPEKMTADYAWGNLGIPAEDCSAFADGWNARAALQSGNSSQPVTVPAGYVLVPVDMAPEMLRAVQRDSTLGTFASAHLRGAYDLYREFWDVAIAAAPAASDGWIPASERLPEAPKVAHFRENENSSTKLFREIGETSTKCWCRTCRPITISDMRFVVCPDCGNKRFPKANDHRNACTGSNEPGQEGSAYPDAPKVKP